MNLALLHRVPQLMSDGTSWETLLKPPEDLLMAQYLQQQTLRRRVRRRLGMAPLPR
jgi:hypothetical protein